MNYFIFKDIDSRSIEGLIVQELPPISKPAKKADKIEIDGRDGDIIEEKGYQAYDKTISIGLTKKYNINQIISWLNGTGKLTMSNEPNKYYNANIIEQIDFERLVRFKTAKIKFHCQPFKHKANEEYLLIKDRKDKTFSGENIGLNDSAEMRLQSLEIQGNSRQETTTQSNNIFDPKKAIVREISNWWSTVISNITDNTSVTIDEGNFLHGTSSTYLVVVVPFKFKKNKTIYNKTPKLGNSLMIYNETGHNICEQGVNLSDNYTPTETFEGYLGVRIEKTINVDDTYVFFSYDENAEFEKFTPDSPSPDYPSEVESCGDNVNLFDKDNAIILNAYVENTNNKIINSNTERIIICECKANTTYTISKNVKTNLNRFRIDCANKRPVLEDTVTKLFYNNEVNNATITTTEDAKYLILQMHSEASAETVTREEVLNSIKIEVGSTPTPYSKFEQGNISFEMCNKNLAKTSKVGQHGTPIIKFSEKYTGPLTIAMKPISGNTQLNYRFFYADGTAGGDNSVTLVNTENNKWYCISLNVKNVIGIGTYNVVRQGYTNRTLEKQFIAKGQYSIQSDKDYIEHKSQTYTIPTQKPFRKIDSYKDVFINKNGKWYERHLAKREILKGTENWTKSLSAQNGYYTSTFVNYIGESLKWFSNMFKIANVNEYNSNTDNYLVYINNANKNISISLPTKIASTVEEFKAFLQEKYNSGTPVYIDYVLSEPKDIECTVEQTEILDKIENEAKTYKRVTHIYSTDEISPVFEGTYNKDIEAMINNIATTVAEREE